MNKKMIVNIFSTFSLQFVAIISGFIIPRLILDSFGSEINGLVASLTQFLNYISLIEGGISSVIMASLYKPLSMNDSYMVNRIVKATNKFFKTIGLIFVVYMIGLAAIYPFIVNTSFSWSYIFTLTLILGISLFIQYFFSLTWKLLLQADQKVYYSSFVQIVVIVFNTIITIIVIKIFPNVHIVKLLAAIAFVIQPILFNYYIKKHYDINDNVMPDEKALEQRWDGFGINVAAFLHSNTDIVILTLLSTLKNVSIYSIYYLVAGGVKSLIVSISSGIVPTIGNLYAANKEHEVNTVFNVYEFIMFFITFFVFTVSALIIVPFVLVYTSGVHDANYNQPIFSILLILSVGMFCLREPYVNMAYLAGHFRKVSKFAYVEAGLNLIFSFLFVYQFGLNGVAFGTLISMTYRTLSQVIYLKNEIIYRSPLIFIKKVLIFSICSLFTYFICRFLLVLESSSMLTWVLLAIKVSSITLLVEIIFCFIFFKKECLLLINNKFLSNLRSKK